MRVWYRVVVDHDSSTAQITLERIIMERVELYRAVHSPGEEHPHDHEAYPHRQLHTYGGGGRVVSAETTGSQVGRPLPDIQRSYLGVA